MTTKSRDEVVRIIHRVTGKIDGPLLTRFMNVVADVVFTRLHTAFLVKAHTGGPDEFGDTWDDLADSTKRAKANLERDNRVDEWERRQEQLTRQLVSAGMSRADASAKATSLAWGEIDVDSPINIRTGALLKSFDPDGGEGQVREIGNPSVFGTDISYSGFVHRGFVLDDDAETVVRPPRRLLPDVEGLASLIASAASTAARDVLVDELNRELR